MGVIRRLLALVVLLCGAALAGVAAYTFFYTRPAELPAGANVVVLSAGTEGGQMDAVTAERTATGIALYQTLVARGESPILVMSGGRGAGAPAAKATLMADSARAAGVPVGDIRVEVESHSTLQNALFVREVLGEAADAPVILVTNRFHLPRAWASFRWAGMHDITLYSAEPEEAAPDTGALILEALKWPANLARAGVFSAMTLVGADGGDLAPLLR
ncbi:YdcF family protein [Palleronia sp. KMU-117]|uniref:YdcF family protein n=1 Tax=Palleronia sp. KMU-117 TaxID=3434108 RepID=UPI003D74B31B